jgi:subtilase family serine protease
MCCRKTKCLLSVFAFCIAIALIAVPAFPQAANAGRVLPKPQLLGPESLSKQITVNVWLKQRNKAAFDALVRQMYDKSSPNYHHWLTISEYKQKFALTDAEAATVRQHLTNNNMSVVSTDKLNLVVTARGAVADVQRAFGVQLNRVSLNGAIHRMPAAEPSIAGAAAPLISTVQGLSDLTYQNFAKRRINPDTGQPEPMVPVKTAAAAPSSVVKFFNANCYTGPQTKFFPTPGGGPRAVYTGARYGNNIFAGPPSLPPCGYNAPQIQTAYGLKDLYKQKVGTQKLDGTGQNIVIVDAFGSDTITSDANIFSEINGLPPLTPDNFLILYPTGPASCGGVCGSWADETSLDVEWAHAVAPGANIILLLAADNSFTNLDLSVLFAIENLIGPVISNSYGLGEIVLETYFPSELTVLDTLSQLAAALGMSNNFATGDSGDYFLSYGVTTVSMPAAAPYSVAVGGTSLFLNSNRSIKFQTGWGNNETRIADVLPNPPVIPPLNLGFVFGAGGGESQVFAKPSYQSSLPGAGRQLPDISYVGDPFTGVEYIITDPTNPAGGPLIGVIGGTSLSCPMFSALWAIANQAVGGDVFLGTSLGQASPLLYGLPSDAISDVLAVTSPNNVTGTVYIPHTPPYTESADSLAAPLENTTDYISAMYNSPFSTRWFVLTFGTDSSLTTGPGWDNVTGLGTPTGAAFVNDIVSSFVSTRPTR